MPKCTILNFPGNTKVFLYHEYHAIIATDRVVDSTDVPSTTDDDGVHTTWWPGRVGTITGRTVAGVVVFVLLVFVVYCRRSEVSFYLSICLTYLHNASLQTYIVSKMLYNIHLCKTIRYSFIFMGRRHLLLDNLPGTNTGDMATWGNAHCFCIRLIAH